MPIHKFDDVTLTGGLTTQLTDIIEVPRRRSDSGTFQMAFSNANLVAAQGIFLIGYTNPEAIPTGDSVVLAGPYVYAGTAGEDLIVRRVPLLPHMRFAFLQAFSFPAGTVISTWLEYN